MNNELVEKKLSTFLEEVASDSPTPGGGSVAATVGAMGASLASMVSQLTIGKKGYEEVEDLFKQKCKEFEKLRKKLMRQIDLDTNAFNRLMDAFKMPKDTKKQKKKRKKKIQEEFKNATQIPLETAQYARKLIDLIDEVALKGNENALSDIAVAALCGLTAVKAAALNVRINLPSIKDEEFVNSRQNKLETLLSGVDETVFQLVNTIQEQIQKH